METKECKRCREKKLFEDFNKSQKTKTGLQAKCRECEKIYHFERRDIRKQNYIDNKEFVILKSKQRYINKKEEIKEYLCNWKVKNPDYMKNWLILNRDHKNQYNNNLYHSDILYRIKDNFRSNLHLSLNKLFEGKFIKSKQTQDILGCTFEEFKLYIESLWEPWMTWENKGKYNGEFNYGWDIDHIIPLSSAKTEEDVYKLNHFSNLQPLCSKINRYIKKDNINF